MNVEYSITNILNDEDLDSELYVLRVAVEEIGWVILIFRRMLRAAPAMGEQLGRFDAVGIKTLPDDDKTLDIYESPGDDRLAIVL